MSKPNFSIFIGASALAIVAAAVYLGSAPSQNSPDAQNQTSGLSSATSILDNDKSGRNSGGADPNLVLNPEDYSSNPRREPWEKKILETVGSNTMSDAVKVQQLLAMVPQLGSDGKVLALEHAAKLIPDADYVSLRPRLLALAGTPELREVVVLDVLTRDDSVRMPSLVEMLRLPNSPDQTEIREVLEAFLDQDHGSDAKQWELAVNKWLAANAES